MLVSARRNAHDHRAQPEVVVSLVVHHSAAQVLAFSLLVGTGRSRFEQFAAVSSSQSHIDRRLLRASIVSRPADFLSNAHVRFDLLRNHQVRLRLELHVSTESHAVARATVIRSYLHALCIEEYSWLSTPTRRVYY